MGVPWTQLALLVLILAATEAARNSHRVVGDQCHTRTSPGLWCQVTRYCLGAEQGNRCLPGRAMLEGEQLACCHTKSRPRGNIVNDWTSFSRRPVAATPPPTAEYPWFPTEDLWPQTDEVPATTRTTPRPRTVTKPTKASLNLPSVEQALAIARTKCLAYGEYSYVVKLPATLLPDPKPIRELRCPFIGQPLISGGKSAKSGEFPHMVALGYELPENSGNKKVTDSADDEADGADEAGQDNGIAWRCGGSLISELIVMTAAHCTSSKITGPVRWAQLGSIQLNDPRSQRIKIDKIIRHPAYSSSSHYDDIALLRLEKEPILSPDLRPACIGMYRAPAVRAGSFGTALDVTGWGLNTTGGSGLTHLMKVDLYLVAMEKCEELFKYLKGRRKLKEGIRPDSMLCIGNKAKIKNSCQGDSGGPVQTKLDAKVFGCMYDVLGITSFGENSCGDEVLTASIYTNVRHFLPWIVAIVWPEEGYFVDPQ